MHPDITTFQAKLYVQTLRREAYPQFGEADDDRKQIVTSGFRLSPKDHWEYNGVLETFRSWSDSGRKTALWIGGSSGNQDNWVTEMSVDLVRALDSQDKTVGAVFCTSSFSESSSLGEEGTSGPGHNVITPVILITKLIIQLLEAYPLLAFRNPELLNARSLKRLQTLDQAWDMWERLVYRVVHQELYIVVDRVDKCVATEHASVRRTLLPRLVGMAKAPSHVSVIITSGVAPPDEMCGELQFFWRDTGISAHQRYARR